MAERPYSEKDLGGGVKKVTWAGLTKATDDTGEWYEVQRMGARFPDKTVHVYGTFGSGGNLRMQGSNEDTPANPFTMEDHAGLDMDFTATAGKLAAQNPMFIRPAITAGDGTTDLSCEMIIGR